MKHMEQPTQSMEEKEIKLCLEGYRTAEDGIERTHYKDRALKALALSYAQGRADMAREVREEAIEPVAEAIYNQMSYYEDGVKPKWTIGGNSLKQDEARTLARKTLASLSELEKEI